MRFQTVYTEITNRCNLNCSTCYNRSGLNKSPQEVSLEQIEYILQRCSEYGATRFLFSGGEPTLHSQFHDLLHLLDHYPQFSIGFVTNGTVHDKEFVAFLNTHKNVTVQISLDGADEESNRLTRGENHFQKAIDFIQLLQLPAEKKLLKMVISKNNFNCVEDFYRLAVSLSCVPEFAFIYKSGNASDDWEKKALSAQQKLSVLRIVRALNAQYGLEAYLPMCTVRCPYSSGANQMSICIKTDGSIQPCQALYTAPFSIGNIFSSSVDEIERLVYNVVTLARQRLLQDYGCEKCLLRSGCGKGCMADAVNNFGNPLTNDDNCVFRKLQFLDMYVTN